MLQQFRNLFVVEYSVEQDAFHIMTVGEMLKANVGKVARRVSTDYIPLDFTRTYDEASASVEKLRPVVNQLINSDRERRRERIREELGVSLSLSDFS